MKNDRNVISIIISRKHDSDRTGGSACSATGTDDSKPGVTWLSTATTTEERATGEKEETASKQEEIDGKKEGAIVVAGLHTGQSIDYYYFFFSLANNTLLLILPAEHREVMFACRDRTPVRSRKKELRLPNKFGGSSQD